MPAVEIRVVNETTAFFDEDPPGYFSVVGSMTEDPTGSGLYDVPSYFVPSPDVVGLYTIPAQYVGDNTTTLRNLSSFSVQEDATPIDPASSAGGVGRIQVNLDDGRDTASYMGQITLVDAANGKTSGAINNISSTNGVATLTADSAMGLFNTDRTVDPFVGTLQEAIQFYASAVGITNVVSVDASLASRSVIYPGFKGNVWVHIKHIMVREQAEMALVLNRIVVRPIRQLEANLSRSTSASYSVSNTNAARAIEIAYYNHTYGNQVEIYPLATEEPSIYSVSAGETSVIELNLNASVTSVNQPVVQTTVPNSSAAGSNGRYSVTGADNLPITAAQWTSRGGSLKVEKTDDPSIIRITIKGASDPTGLLSPYRIAMSSGAGNDYNSLRITGTAVKWDRQTVTIPTGATNVTTSDEVSALIDNPFIRTREEAYSLGLIAAGNQAGIEYRVSGDAIGINRTGQTGLVRATIADFNAQVPPSTTITTFNEEWAGQSIADFNAYWQAFVDNAFSNQLYGNIVGARVHQREAVFRIDSASTNAEGSSFSALMDTTITDFNPIWSGATIADFNEQFVGYTCKRYSIVPLRRD